MSKHTPGPWTGYPANISPNIEADGKCIAQVNPHNGDSEERRTANARIIAAAPELLEALKSIVFYYKTLRGKVCLRDGYPDPAAIIENMDHKIAQLEAVIAKAEGREK